MSAAGYTTTTTMPEPKPIDQDLAAIFERMRVNRGFPEMTPEREAEFAREEKARHEQELAELAQRWRVGDFHRICPKEFREPWDWSKADAKADRAEIERIWNWKHGPRGLYIIGRTGLAKTRAVYVLLRRLMVDERRKVKFITGVEFAVEAAEAFGEPSRTKYWLREFYTAPTLVIDDVAKRWTPATEDAFFDIVDHRYAAQRPIIATTNYTKAALQRMSAARGEAAAARDMIEPITRRLRECCEVICPEEGAGA